MRDGDGVTEEPQYARPRVKPLWISGALVLAVAAVVLALLGSAAWIRDRFPDSTFAWISALLLAGLAWFIVDVLASEALAAAFHRLHALLPVSVQRVLERGVGGPLMLLGILSLIAALFVWVVVAYGP